MVRLIHERDMEDAILLRTIVINEVIPQVEQDSELLPSFTALRIFPAPFVAERYSPQPNCRWDHWQRTINRNGDIYLFDIFLLVFLNLLLTMLTPLSTWLTTISLIFGGCCSNAITLEQLTLQHPDSGSVLTLLQFLLISLHGLPKFLIWTRYGPRFRPRRVPIAQYLIQVILFYLVSLLNNAAFAYRIPMAVHIIFRSGGLVVSMFIGWLVSNKRYVF